MKIFNKIKLLSSNEEGLEPYDEIRVKEFKPPAGFGVTRNSVRCVPEYYWVVDHLSDSELRIRDDSNAKDPRSNKRTLLKNYNTQWLGQRTMPLPGVKELRDKIIRYHWEWLSGTYTYQIQDHWDSHPLNEIW